MKITQNLKDLINQFEFNDQLATEITEKILTSLILKIAPKVLKRLFVSKTLMSYFSLYSMSIMTSIFHTYLNPSYSFKTLVTLL